MTDLDALRYPIGKFLAPASIEEINIEAMVSNLAALPAKMRRETLNLNDLQLDTPYREGGWTIRQVVHHVADSHINCYCRFKLAMTEENPVIKPYFENLWAELPDGKSAPVKVSLDLLEAVHIRLDLLLKSFQRVDYLRTYVHPEYNRVFYLFQVLANYSWHSDHHLAHVTVLKKKMGW